MTGVVLGLERKGDGKVLLLLLLNCHCDVDDEDMTDGSPGDIATLLVGLYFMPLLLLLLRQADPPSVLRCRLSASSLLNDL